MKGSVMEIADYLSQDLILFLEASSRNDALEKLVAALDRAGKLPDCDAFFKAILQREKVVSTGVGLGIAIPHAKCEGFDDFFIAIGIQNASRELEWNSLDGKPVRLIFMIGGPENRQTDYLHILSALTTFIKDPNRRKALLAATNSKEILKLF